MKPESVWSFSAPLSKVDVPRIVDEAADVGTTLGVVKVLIESPKGASIFVLADLDLAAEASAHRGVRAPDALVSTTARLDRDFHGVGRVNGLIDPRSFAGMVSILSVRSGIVLFAVRDDVEARQLINKLLDKVTVTVEAY